MAVLIKITGPITVRVASVSARVRCFRPNFRNKLAWKQKLATKVSQVCYTFFS